MVLQVPERRLIAPARGDGVWVFDSAGSRYLDAYNNCIHIGHGHPRIEAAIDRRWPLAAKWCAERLRAKLHAGMDRVYFCRSGVEANELALRLAQWHTKATGVIACAGSGQADVRLLDPFSAVTASGAALPVWMRAVTVPDAIQHAEEDTGSLSGRFLAEVADTVQELVKRGFGMAGIVFDPVLAYEGMAAVSAQTASAAIEIVVRAGGLYIADEAQGGLGRVGRFWAHECCARSPDIVTLGRPLANGAAIGAAIVGRHVSELPGFPVARDPADLAGCAAALATLEVLETEKLIESAVGVGAYLRYRLAELVEGHPMLGGVRGEGLHQALEFVTDRRTPTRNSSEARRVAEEMARRGVLVGLGGSRTHLIRIRPPMTFTLEHVDLLVNTAEDALRATAPS